MKPELPPMQTLLAFEAAARHLSCTKAAEELKLTRTAISHQIRALEKRLDMKLFERVGNVLVLTDAAREYLETVRQAIALLTTASESTRRRKTNPVLTISCPADYAVSCLVPQLHDFQRRHPDIELHLLAGCGSEDGIGEEADVRIRRGHGRWDGLHSVLLNREEFFPVCAPSLLRTIGSVPAPERLGRLVRIRTYQRSRSEDDWPLWLAAAGLEQARFAGETVHRLPLTAQSAAEAGVGIAIGRTPLVNRGLALGSLVAPFDTRCSSPAAYYLTSALTTKDSHKVSAFRQWALSALTDRPTSTRPQDTSKATLQLALA